MITTQDRVDDLIDALKMLNPRPRKEWLGRFLETLEDAVGEAGLKDVQFLLAERLGKGNRIEPDAPRLWLSTWPNGVVHALVTAHHTECHRVPPAKAREWQEEISRFLRGLDNVCKACRRAMKGRSSS